MACFSAENKADAWIEELQCFTPLESAFGVVFRCHLLDLPGSPDLVVLTQKVISEDEREGDLPRFLEPNI